ncbi:MAG: hypothetical protein RIC06_15570 [Cyclobacteriaceae bacterium]
MLTYIKTLTRNYPAKFYLITFEQERYSVPPNDQQLIQEELSQQGIIWLPLKYHTGRSLLLKKSFDLAIGFIKVLRLRLFSNASVIFSFANVSASFGIIMAKLLGMKLYVYSYEPHSEFMADFGYWNKSGLKYKLLNWLEWKVGIHADVVITGTKFMVDALEKKGSKARVFRAPTAVDSNDFFYSEKSRNELRKVLSLESRKVFVYAGKFGGLYYTDEIFSFFSQILLKIPSAYLLVLTPDDQSEVRQMALQYLNASDFMIKYLSNNREMSGHLSAADFGISSIPPYPSQKFRSPTKVAEYLLCGLPYITSKGISEDDIYARERKVGVVVKNFGKLTSQNSDELNDILKEDKNILSERCRAVGLEYRSKERIDQIFRQIFT